MKTTKNYKNMEINGNNITITEIGIETAIRNLTAEIEAAKEEAVDMIRTGRRDNLLEKLGEVTWLENELVDAILASIEPIK